MLPTYLQLYKSGELKKRAEILISKLSSCTICPRHCHVDRSEDRSRREEKGEKVIGEKEEGFCKTGRKPIVSSTVAHFGEEPVLVGKNGAGNVFFGHCNLRCVYCQNWQISHPVGKARQNEITSQELADRLLSLQNKGCHNINFVSPSHFVAQMVEAIFLACQKGLRLPIVYNTNAFDDVETLKLLEGIVDIYLPDIKYADDVAAVKYSQARDYWQTSKEAIKEMYRQVGNLVLDENGIAQRGLIVRHLILPNDVAETEECLRFLANEISPEISVSLMAQYYPTNKSDRVPLLDRKIRVSEYEKAVSYLEKFGLKNGWVQEMEASETYRPNFEKEKPFNNAELGMVV